MKSNERVFENVSPTRSKTMSKIRGKDTKIEILLRKALWKKGIRYRKNYRKLPGSPDIAIIKYKIAIFCDSEFWHGKNWDELSKKLSKGNNSNYWVKKIDENIQRDKEKDMALRTLEWEVLHFWESDIKNNLEDCVRAIQETIIKQRIRQGDLDGFF